MQESFIRQHECVSLAVANTAVFLCLCLYILYERPFCSFLELCSRSETRPCHTGADLKRLASPRLDSLRYTLDWTACRREVIGHLTLLHVVV